MTKIQVIFFLCVTLLHIETQTATSKTLNNAGTDGDRTALLALKSNIKNDSKGFLNSWNRSLHFCDWQGITCSARHKRVTDLNLRSANLVGSLSQYIGNLSFLRSLDLSNNAFQGEIPPQIGRLFRLRLLSLESNLFDGELPPTLFACTNLLRLLIGQNKFTGKFPEEIGLLTKLEILRFWDNNFTGGIPFSIGNLTSLQVLSAGYNKLGGKIPDIFHRLRNLDAIGLAKKNNLSGTIPLSLYNLSLLTTFSIPENNLHGTIPANLGLLFPKLVFFQIRHNNFSGSIPLSLSNASNLIHIEMDANKFSGKVSVDFSALRHLESFTISKNSFGTGEDDDLMFVRTFLNLSSLRVIGIAYNQFGGELPIFLGNFSSRINFIHAGSNNISGYIPSWIGSLTRLTFLAMHRNKLIGSIPESLGNLHNLTRLYLHENALSGALPSSLGNLSLLTDLNLRNNTLNGTVSSGLGNCQNMLNLYLNENRFSGSIPPEIFNLSNLVLLRLNQNQLSGFLPSEVGKLRNLKELRVSENQLSGLIPSGIGGCVFLEYVYMDGNRFYGTIPSSLSSLMGLEELDISRNSLSGEIPNFLGEFDLTYLNLSFNDFEGGLPTRGVFTNSTALSIVGNERLCGGIASLNLGACSLKEESRSATLSSLAVILISTTCAVFGFILLSTFIYFLLRKKRKVKASESMKKLWKVSYGMLLKATDNFSNTNLIGVGSFGSVYKGTFNENETTVAIKVLNLQRRGASKSFMAECEALKNIRHRNLVKIITSCSSVDFHGNDFKALVYELMPNGSLEKWLSEITETSTDQNQIMETTTDENHISEIALVNTNQNQIRYLKLNLIQRVNIAIDVASALEYLHLYCTPAMVHCDLKPSNVLLDADMTAHVGDFGLSKFLHECTNPDQISSIGIRGTIGYAAPEYGLGSEVSTNGDMYSYGILLLEMITGKAPTNEMFEEGFTLHRYAESALADHDPATRVMAIVDPFLLPISYDGDREDEASTSSSNTENRRRNERKVECLVKMAKIGVCCSVESPHERMDIAGVIRELNAVEILLRAPARVRPRRGLSVVVPPRH